MPELRRIPPRNTETQLIFSWATFALLMILYFVPYTFAGIYSLPLTLCFQSFGFFNVVSTIVVPLAIYVKIFKKDVLCPNLGSDLNDNSFGILMCLTVFTVMCVQGPEENRSALRMPLAFGWLITLCLASWSFLVVAILVTFFTHYTMRLVAEL